MNTRLNVFATGHRGIKALFGIGAHLSRSTIEQSLFELIYFRVSQINGCAYCVDMHSKDLRARGETEQRLYMLSPWREAPVYTERERAALAFAEAVNSIGNGVPDDVYENAAAVFSDEELIDLVLAVSTVGTYNRINITFGTPAGDYQPGQYKSLVNQS
jgi:AhpD family alkylhydroperoxidase